GTVRARARTPLQRPLAYLTDTSTPEHQTFPYTTLFRSARDGIDRAFDLDDQFRHVDDIFARVFEASPSRAALPAVAAAGSAALEDRKSTRLNSSHVAISYAVFCLKKKSRREGARLSALA